jgi:hypothetical protein
MFSIFHSEIVTLLVGPEKVALRVHKDLICSKSEFFRACLETDFSEAGSKTVALPEDGIEQVEAFLTWIYRGTFELSINERGGVSADNYKPYAFGDKILAEEFCNVIMDKIRAQLAKSKEFLGSSSLRALHKLGLKDSPLASFATKAFVYEMMAINREEGYWSKFMAKCYEDKSVMEAIMTEIFRFRIKSWTDPNTWKGCHFHVHKNGSKCAAMEKATTTT